MKTTVDLAAFKSALNTVRGAVASRTALPILANVLIDADGDRLTLRATDLKMAVSCHLPAEIDEPGATTVDARLLWEFVSTLPTTGPATLTLDPVRLSLRIRAGGSDGRFNGIHPDDFPRVLSAIDPGLPTFSVPAEVLERAYRLVSIAVLETDDRPVLTGVSLRPDGANLAFAASDGFAMGHYSTPVSSVPSDLDIIVPAKTLKVLAGILPGDGEVTMQVSENRSQVVAAFGETVWSSQLIDGTYPPILQIIPKQHRTRVELDGDVLQRALRQAMVFAAENNRVVLVEATPPADDVTPGNLAISATAAERGDGRSVIDVLVEGEAVAIKFDGRYLLGCLDAMRKPGRVAIATNGPKVAAKFGGSSVPGYTFVAMPMVAKGDA